MNKPHREYTIAQAAEELNVSEELIKEVLPQLGANLAADNSRSLTEDEVNRILDILNNPARTPTAAG